MEQGVDQGYSDKRFQNVIDENFHCPICMNVLKYPVQCRRNEHYFCTPCILRHLEQNAQTCPVCIDALTPKTLKEPSRIVMNYLSTLKISCDYASRGCRDVVELRLLRAHVENCDFCPVVCANEGCSKSISKRDRKQHETEVCKYRKMKCTGCGKRVQSKKYETHGCVLKKVMEDLKGNYEEMKEELEQVKELTKKMDLRQTAQEKIIKEMRTMMVEMRQEMSKLTNQSPARLPKAHIVIAGGHDGSTYLNSAEMFNTTTKAWLSLPPMKERRLAPTSFAFKNNVIISGGFDGDSSTEGMERLSMSQQPKQWLDFPVKLPFKSNRHSCVVFQNRLLIAGGEDAAGSKVSDGIYEVQITPPHTSVLVGRLPQARVGHGAVIFNDKMLIVGGRTTIRYKDGIDSVLLFDINKRKGKEMSPLPFEVSQMATVCHGDSLFVIGGQDKEGNILNKVVMYDIETGKCQMLPSMKRKRAACTAVIAGNVIVVMGGRDGKDYLNSVECFSLDRRVWEELPAMTTPRTYATSLLMPDV